MELRPFHDRQLNRDLQAVLATWDIRSEIWALVEDEFIIFALSGCLFGAGEWVRLDEDKGNLSANGRVVSNFDVINRAVKAAGIRRSCQTFILLCFPIFLGSRAEECQTLL